MHAGKWEKKSLQGAELRGKTLGILGLGRIGLEVARRARAFDMRVIAVTRTPMAHALADEMLPLAALPEALAQADAVVLALPLVAQTHHLLDAAVLARCKPGLLPDGTLSSR